MHAHFDARSFAFPTKGGGREAGDLLMKQLHVIVLGATLATASLLSAQTTPADGPRGPGGPGGRGPGGRGGHPIVRALDADQNHEISATELANASAAILTLDANKDGAVSADELHPARPTPPDGVTPPTPPAGAPARDATHRPADPVMLALDANSDGALSAAEIANASKSLAALDANKDGKLTLDELRPLPPTN